MIRIPIAILALATLGAGILVAQPPREFSDQSELSAQAGPRLHQKSQKRPIKLGTSGGNLDDFTLDLTSVTCCSGTLGGLIEKNGEHFILSNNHVMALTNLGSAGDLINQPGLLDGSCPAPPATAIAELTGYKALKFNGRRNKVDAAIARVLDDSVSPTGKILEVGEPGNTTVKPQLGMRVKKSGRTTGLTHGVITDVNVTVPVGYTEECSETSPALSALFVKTFWMESTNAQDFSTGGDSGSIILEDVDECPRAVGLLFAGGGRTTIANGMSAVLKAAKKMKPKGKATLVGCDPAEAGSGFAIERGSPALVDERQVRVAARIQKRAESRILDLAGVHAMGIGRSSTDPSEAVFRVFVDNTRPAALAEIPSQIDGVDVEVVERPRMHALNCPTAAASAIATAN